MQDLSLLIRHWLTDPYVTKFALAIGGIFFISIVSRLAKRSLPHYLPGSDSRYYARKIITFLGYFGVLILVASIFRDSLGGLSVAIGVASAGIAFALQEVIASVAGWIAISFGGFYETGDRVQLGGIRGDVIDIGILRTTLMELGEWVQSDLYTGRIVRIANSFVFKEPVFNYSGDFPFLWDEIKVPVKYGSDHRLARRILERVVQEVVSQETTEKAMTAWKGMVQQVSGRECQGRTDGHPGRSRTTGWSSPSATWWTTRSAGSPRIGSFRGSSMSSSRPSGAWRSPPPRCTWWRRPEFRVRMTTPEP